MMEGVKYIMPKFLVNQDYVPLSVYFIETFLKDVSGIFLKVYLYALSLATRGISADTAEISKELNILESDVLQAFSFWKNEGMIIEEGGVIEFVARPLEIHPVSNQSLPQTQTSDKAHYDSIEIAKKISEDQSLSELVILTQELLAKPLTPQDLETIYWFNEGLGFSSEAILLILDYCVVREKRNLKYIEKVALSWHEKGIRTADEIMEYLAEEEKKNSVIYKIQKTMGIGNRVLSPAEEQYLIRWTEEYQMSEEMVLLAYDNCLLNTSKLSFPYMDKIIQRWNKQGIHTIEAAEADNRNFKKNSKGFDAFHDDFDHAALEKLTRK